MRIVYAGPLYHLIARDSNREGGLLNHLAEDPARPGRARCRRAPSDASRANRSRSWPRYRRHGYTLGEIAAQLGCRYSTFSGRLRREETANARCKTRHSACRYPR
jgi:hypothetical protein